MSERRFTRRTAVAAGLAGTALAAAGSQVMSEPSSSAGRRMPVAYLPHGGGPWSYVDLGFPQDEVDELVTRWRELAGSLPAKPRALLVVSAHWEEAVPTVMTAARPPMLYDYYGFPDAAYDITWPAPGDPALAKRVGALLEEAGLSSAEDAERGFDHGTFVPLGRIFPEADVPTVQLSLQKGLDPEAHLALGRALAPLRDEGVLLVGSGMSYHNMRGFRAPFGPPDSEVFDRWLAETMALEPKERSARLARWEDAPKARAAHPREEHLLPLMVMVGAAEDAPVSSSYSARVMGTRVAGYQLG